MYILCDVDVEPAKVIHIPIRTPHHCSHRMKITTNDLSFYCYKCTYNV